MTTKTLHKSIEFLLENAGPVIQYRLRKDILHNLSANEEGKLLEQIYMLPQYQLVKSYVKPNGYIGSGMHGFSNGVVKYFTRRLYRMVRMRHVC